MHVPAAGQPEALETSVIMMVDDEETTLSVLEAFLESEGYSRFVSTTESSKALELAAAHKPDVLLLDLNMPGDLGGFEVLERIRARPELHHLPVIILTSATDSQTKLQALELGATDFLAKPVDPSELALRLRNTLSAKAHRDRLTYHDAVTGLPNRQRLLESGDRVLAQAREAGQEGAVLHIALQRFERIHDTLGEAVANALLRAVAHRIQQCVRTTDLLSSDPSQGALCRVGGHEFVLLLPALGPPEHVERLATRILSHLAKPFVWNRRELFVTGHIGIAPVPGDGAEVAKLLHQARSALGAPSARSRFRFYQASSKRESLQRLDIENQLRGALKRNEMRLQYQPQVEIETGRVIGAEALMRWNHPQLGLVSPDRFIPVAEEAGLIEALGEWALGTACQQCQSWIEAGLPPIRVSVNVSGSQIRDSELLTVVKSALSASGLDGRWLVLEMTEGMIMGDPEEATEVLARIKGLKVGITVDDFGTGYSTLSYLKTLPLDALKIDKAFIAGLPSENDDAAIVAAIIAMAQNLGLGVLAEGVETPEQLAFLERKGCELYQGFLFSGPLDAEQMRALLAENGD